jgi:hypothetical protein
MIDHLAKDAQKLAELRGDLHNQGLSAKEFVKDYCRYYNNNQIPKGLLERLENDFELEMDNQIGQLDQIIRDLLQIV